VQDNRHLIVPLGGDKGAGEAGEQGEQGKEFVCCLYSFVSSEVKSYGNMMGE